MMVEESDCKWGLKMVLKLAMMREMMMVEESD